MRRHVENQVQAQEKDSLGILILFVMWALALMALSAAARGEEKLAEGRSEPTSAEQKKPAEVAKTGRSDSSQQAASHHLPISRPNADGSSKTQGTVEAPAPQSEGSEQIELNRFILVSIPDRQLALVDDGKVIKVYAIAVGAHGTPSPEGNFTVISHVANPTWSHKGKVVPPGKNNPVGSRWMGLSLKGYGIHGTNAPRSIGKAASHGCFRMGKKDVEELFALVRVGDTVAVRAERDELVTQVFGDSSHNGEVQVAAATTAAESTDEE